MNRAEIGRYLRRHRSTIGRELRRNAAPYDGWYRAERAQERAVARPLFLLFLSRFTRQHLGCHELPISFSVNLQLGQSAYACIA